MLFQCPIDFESFQSRTHAANGLVSHVVQYIRIGRQYSDHKGKSVQLNSFHIPTRGDIVYVGIFACTNVRVRLNIANVCTWFGCKIKLLTLMWLTLKNVVITNWKIKNYVLEYKIWTSFENYRISRGTNVNAKMGSSWTWCRRKIW